MGLSSGLLTPIPLAELLFEVSTRWEEDSEPVRQHAGAESQCCCVKEKKGLPSLPFGVEGTAACGFACGFAVGSIETFASLRRPPFRSTTGKSDTVSRIPSTASSSILLRRNRPFLTFLSSWNLEPSMFQCNHGRYEQQTSSMRGFKVRFENLRFWATAGGAWLSSGVVRWYLARVEEWCFPNPGSFVAVSGLSSSA